MVIKGTDRSDVVPSLFKAPATCSTPAKSMNCFLADCLLESMDRAGHAISHTPTRMKIKSNYRKIEDVEVRREKE